MPAADEKIETENINTPGKTTRVNRANYEAIRTALLSVLPGAEPGVRVTDAKTALLPLQPESLFPEGRTAGWWLKAIQLDLEAKGITARAATKLIQLHRTA